jgi:6-phosphogluconate dehydrogenase
MNLQVPLTLIDVAVSMRDLSAYKEERKAAQQKLKGPEKNLSSDKTELTVMLEHALYFAMITAYAQGMSLLQAASKEYKYDLKPEKIAKLWRGGCIIRATLLDDIHRAYASTPQLKNLMMDDQLSAKLMHEQASIRNVIIKGVESGIAIPALMAALSYYDGYRSAWLPANLVQAQRDNFGAHTYERVDRTGSFHTHWKQTEKK